MNVTLFNMIAGCGRNNSTILKARCYQSEWCRVVGVVTNCCVYNFFSVSHCLVWWESSIRCKKFIQNCESLIVTQRSLFEPRLYIFNQHTPFQIRILFTHCFRNCSETRSALKRKRPGSPSTVNRSGKFGLCKELNSTVFTVLSTENFILRCK